MQKSMHRFIASVRSLFSEKKKTNRSISIKGPIENESGKLMLRIPLAAGGAELANHTEGIGWIDGSFLKIEIKPWMAEKMGFAEGVLVRVDNLTGKFRIALAEAPPSQPVEPKSKNGLDEILARPHASVFFHATWSGPSVVALRTLRDGLRQRGIPEQEIEIVDVDEEEAEAISRLAHQGYPFNGAGEAAIVRDGIIRHFAVLFSETDSMVHRVNAFLDEHQKA